MIFINGFKISEYSNAVILEPRDIHSQAIIDYDIERDIMVYSERLFLMSLMLENDITYNDALEWLHYNTLAISGVENFPIFIDDYGEYL